jgi:hypothetical protein
MEHTKFSENIKPDFTTPKKILWYENPSVLIKNIDVFIPTNDLSRVEKINALARFAIYYSLAIIIFNLDSKWFSVAVVILLLSLFLGCTEPFTNTNILSNTCQHPTPNNPFMNYTLADGMTNPERKSACKYEDVKPEIRKHFRSKMHADQSDIFGRNITERNFYIMPNTRMINDQTEAAKWFFNIYEAGSTCKENGENCLLAIDPRYQKGRVIIKENE